MNTQRQEFRERRAAVEERLLGALRSRRQDIQVLRQRARRLKGRIRKLEETKASSASVCPQAGLACRSHRPFLDPEDPSLLHHWPHFFILALRSLPKGGANDVSRRRTRLPVWVRTDATFGVLHAYYTFVKRADVWFPDDGRGKFCAVEARSRDTYFGADFSTPYEFPPERGAASVKRRLQRQAEHLLTWRQLDGETEAVIFEVWCFFPPSQRLLSVATQFQPPSPCTFHLVHGEELWQRIRTAVLALPPRKVPCQEEPETAFVDCGQLIRAAFRLE